MVCRTKGVILCSLLPAFHACCSTPSLLPSEFRPAPNCARQKYAERATDLIKNELVVGMRSAIFEIPRNHWPISYVRTHP